MDWLNYIWIIFVGLGAGFVQRVSGFGLGIFAMMFLPHFTPTHTAAAAISSLFSCVTSSYNAVKYRKNAVYKTALPMICAALIAIPLAVRFSALVAADIFKLLLGGVLVALGVYFLFVNGKVKIKPTFLSGLLAGALGGTLGGLFSTGGPPAVLYVSSATSSNIAYFATIQFYFCFTNLYATTMRVINGVINEQVLLFAAVGMIGCMIGDTIGKMVFDKLNAKMLKTIIYIGMIISGIVMFI